MRFLLKLYSSCHHSYSMRYMRGMRFNLTDWQRRRVKRWAYSLHTDFDPMKSGMNKKMFEFAFLDKIWVKLMINFSISYLWWVSMRSLVSRLNSIVLVSQSPAFIHFSTNIEFFIFWSQKRLPQQCERFDRYQCRSLAGIDLNWSSIIASVYNTKPIVFEFDLFGNFYQVTRSHPSCTLLQTVINVVRFWKLIGLDQTLKKTLFELLACWHFLLYIYREARNLTLKLFEASW